MIPSDLAARLRVLTESIVNPVSPVREIPADLPELAAGQRFTARVEQALPEGAFRALVAGRTVTLSLPESAAPGETLELVVRARTPGLIVAERADQAQARQTPPTTLSRAGQIISTLLAGEERAPQPATIIRAAPLLPEPALQASRLAPALQQAIVESGLFYEAHQAQWIAGRYPAEALAREPQARLARPSRVPDAAVVAQRPEAAPDAERMRGAEPAAARGAALPVPDIPVELQPLIQQQLDAAATQHIVWRGEVWPGQELHWEIEADREQRRASGEEAAEQWTTNLGLSLPRLGQVSVVLTLTPAKVSLAMTANADSTAALKKGLGDLAAAFAAAGLPPLAAGVEAHESA